MKKLILLLTLATGIICICASTAFAQVQGYRTTTKYTPPEDKYVTTTRIVSGYLVGRLRDEIALTPMTFKVRYEVNSMGAKRNICIIAYSNNGLDFTTLPRPDACYESEEWSAYMGKRTMSYYSCLKSASWKSGANNSIENFHMFDRSSLIP